MDIQTKTDDDCYKKLIRMVDTVGGHYSIILETKKKKKSSDIMFVEDDTGILFLEDAKDNLCSFKAIRKVHEVNCHKGKEQLISAYRNAGWMSPDLVNMINCVGQRLSCMPEVPEVSGEAKGVSTKSQILQFDCHL